MPGSKYCGRFAPSPTGPLHFGSLVTALASYLQARSQHGSWHVRVEDIDPPREIPGAAADIVETLSAFGMRSDSQVLMQRSRISIYRRALEKLAAAGLAFPCTCSRSQLAGRVHSGLCDPEVRANPAWRLRVDSGSVSFTDALQRTHAQDVAREVGDFVLFRADGWPTYQLAVVVDDAAQAISEVVRGADLLASTPRQIYLQRCLSLPTPSYVHLPLVLDQLGTKLSKQNLAPAITRASALSCLRQALEFLGQDTEGFGRFSYPEPLLIEATGRWSLASINPRNRQS